MPQVGRARAGASKKAKGAIANVLLAVVSILLVFGVLEVAARAFYPEFAGRVHSADYTAGRRIHTGALLGSKVRLPAPGAIPTIERGDLVYLVFGDSVSLGYGLAYNDVYWAHWQRRLDLSGEGAKVLSLSGYGNNVTDIARGIASAVEALEEEGIEIGGLIYQFNFNDLLPVTRADLQRQQAERSIVDRMRDGSWFASLRHRVLNHSVFQRVASVKLAGLLHNPKASCAELGLTALRGYTYTFGGRGFEPAAERAWESFEHELSRTAIDFAGLPFAVMISPISTLVHPGLPEHQVARPLRLDCATIDPVERLHALADRLDLALCDPTEYMAEAARRFAAEGNPRPLFQENDENHPNEAGSFLMAEYCYARFFDQFVPLDEGPASAGLERRGRTTLRELRPHG